jgi:NAD(P)-dependent dehydrogenase (short-subunit alcohol dehydrogenase family)
LALAANGAAVVVNDTGGDIGGVGGNSDVARGVVEEIRAEGGRAAVNADSVATVAGAAAMVRFAIEKYGSLHVVVNNAGISRQNMLWDMPAADFEAVLATHLQGTWNVMRAAAPVMIEAREGVFINMSSGVGVVGAVANTGYCAAKAGVLGLSWAAALDLGPFGIRVNVLFPAAASRLDTKREVWRERYPTLPRPMMTPGQWPPERIATFVSYLASDAAADINGQLFACGGDTISSYSVWQPDATLKISGEWTFEALAAAVPDRLLVGKPNPSPAQSGSIVWPWIRSDGLPEGHRTLERADKA